MKGSAQVYPLKQQNRPLSQNYTRVDDKTSYRNGRQDVEYDPEKEEVKRWIKNKICRRDCIKYIENTEVDDSSEETCYCNYLEFEHQNSAIKNASENEKWTVEKHTKDSPTNAFGEVQLTGFENKNLKYVRFDVFETETAKEKALTLLFEKWKLQKPNFLLSITGGSTNAHKKEKDSKVKPRLKTLFHRDLMKAAQSTGAWIMTDGLQNGIASLVGKAVRDLQLTATLDQNEVLAIGITPWGKIDDKEAFMNMDGKWPAAYHSDGVLDPNHSCFILADDGTCHPCMELSFRAALEKAISDKKTDAEAAYIPHVLIVAEGDNETFDMVQKSIQYGTPTVIIKGTGGAAEIIAFVAQHCKREVKLGTDESGRYQPIMYGSVDTELKAKIKSLIEQEEFRDKMNTDTQLKLVEKCLRRLDLLIIIDINSKQSSEDIDTAILKAILKDKKQRAVDQLRLTLAFDKIDIAKSDIFTSGNFLSYDDLDAIMMLAIQMNRASFVELLLDHVNLELFLTPERMVRLYNTIPSKSLLFHLLEKYKKGRGGNKYVDLKDVGNLMKSMIGSHFEHYYITEKEFDLKATDLTAIMQPDPERDEDENIVDLDCEMRPWEDLFLWSVLIGYHELADIFWKFGKESLVAALIGNHLLKIMMKETSDGEMKSKFDKKAIQFENLSVEVLQELYTSNEEETRKLLVSDLKNWGNTSIMIIAHHADNKKFISKDACQSLLTEIWWGRIKTEKNLVVKATYGHEQDNSAVGCVEKIQSMVDKNEAINFLRAPARIFAMNVIGAEGKPRVIDNVKNYLRSRWNLVDFLIILIFGFGMILRSVDVFEVFTSGRFILSINILTFFLRILQIFFFHKELGPKLVMIERMLEDLFYFMAILLVFLTSYAVASEAILNQDIVLSPKYIFIDLFRKAYFHIYGELFFDGDDYTASTKFGGYVVMYVLGVYMMICNVLLLNLLIAIFSTTYGKVQDQTDEYWYYQRYHLIEEYASRPVLPPPSIIIIHVYRFYKFLRQRCCKKIPGAKIEAMPSSSKEEESLLNWANTVVQRNFLKKYDKQKEQQSVDSQIQESADRVTSIIDKMDELQFNKRFVTLEEGVSHALEELNWLKSSMKDIHNILSKSQEVPTVIYQEAPKQRDNKEEDRSVEQSQDQSEPVKETRSVHIASRSLYYDMNLVLRFPVPDAKVFWEVNFPEYSPVSYTSSSVLKSEDQMVDKVDLLSIEQSERGSIYQFNAAGRESFTGNTYDVINGLPHNPYGRTGIIGRGSLGCWGPNHVKHAVITRWKRDANGKIKHKKEKPVLQFIALERLDRKQKGCPKLYFLPWDIDLTYEPIEDMKNQSTELMKMHIENCLRTMQEEGEELYCGYADDAKNTDNAWVETIVKNYHDENNLLSYYIIMAKQDSQFKASWRDATSRIPLWGFHSYLLECAVEARDAYY